MKARFRHSSSNQSDVLDPNGYLEIASLGGQKLIATLLVSGVAGRFGPAEDYVLSASSVVYGEETSGSWRR
jgi:hypothetical protein